MFEISRPYKVLQIMFKAKLNILPEGVQKYFRLQKTSYSLRDECKYILPKVKKIIESKKCFFSWG